MIFGLRGCFLLLVPLQVLRCYDNRFFRTHRSPKVYLDERCQGIVGGPVNVITNLTDDYLDLDEYP